MPPNPGPGDDIVIHVDGGVEGDTPVLLVALDPGPTNFPLVGTLDIGLDTLTFYPFAPLDENGSTSLPCSMDCFAATVDPFYMQAIALRAVAGGSFIISEVSQPSTLAIDDTILQDCNLNGIDDECDIEEGEPDCNGNGIPDTCDLIDGTSLDLNDNGILDECEPCDAPETIFEPGRYRVIGNGNGSLAPPNYGLRLDGLLDGDCRQQFIFDFENPASEVYLDFDGTSIRYSGIAWGGLDTGVAMDPFMQSFLTFDVTFDETEVQNGELVVPGTSSSSGTVTWLATNTTVAVTGKANSAGYLFILKEDGNGGIVSLGWLDTGNGCESDISTNESVATNTCACEAPVKAGDVGRWKLGNKDLGQIAPPNYGLRLDGLFGDYPNQYTFDYEYAGAGVYLEYDGANIRIVGSAYGGLDIGGGWDPVQQGWLMIDVTWEAPVLDSTGCEMIVPDSSLVYGSVIWVNDGTEVPLFGASNGSHQLRFFADGTTTELASWVMYDTGKPGCCQDLNSDSGVSIDDCPE